MSVFNTTKTIDTPKWYLEWNFLSHHEYTLLGIGFNFPTFRDKTFFLSLSLFSLSLFWVEIHYKGAKKV